jgi:hypothetical protein
MLDFQRGSRFAIHQVLRNVFLCPHPRRQKCDRHSQFMTIQELEQIEDRARRGLHIDPDSILMLTAYLRDVLQAKASAEAVASAALKQAGLNSRYHTAGISPAS